VVSVSGALTPHKPSPARWQWRFSRHDDRQGWVVPDDVTAVVMGGSLWVSLVPRPSDASTISSIEYQIDGTRAARDAHTDSGVELLSPGGLNLTARDGERVRVRLRMLNLSPNTDILMRSDTEPRRGWWTAQDGWGDFGPWPAGDHCALLPDAKEWQEVVCHVGGAGELVDRIAIYIPQRSRGDLWIESVEIDVAPAPTPPVRPDLISDRVVPRVSLPGISQEGFHDAFQVLDDCLMVDVPVFGFPYPFFTPGRFFSWGGWWETDTSLAAGGAKWVDQRMAEDVMRGFGRVQAQNPDGRIDLNPHTAIRGQVGDASQVPSFLGVAYDIARRSDDENLRAEIYRTMRNYLDWWLSPVKRDTSTGLVTGVFEELQGEFLHHDLVKVAPQTFAPVELNVAVAVGARRTADLASALGRTEESARYLEAYRDVIRAINAYCWDDADGAYYSYDLRRGARHRRLVATTFDPLRLGIAPADRRDRLLRRLVDPHQFNWGTLPLTSLAKTEADYSDSGYWTGGIWSVRNLSVIAGLKESGFSELAAELNWATIRAFHGKYSEYLDAGTGETIGLEPRFAWSASLYIQAVIEHLFGVDVDVARKRMRIEPHIPPALFGEDLALENLVHPADPRSRISIRVNQVSASAARFRIDLAGPVPGETVEIKLPGCAAIDLPASDLLEVTIP
jgi:hypothetical protein